MLWFGFPALKCRLGSISKYTGYDRLLHWGQICEPCSESALPAVPQQVQPSTQHSTSFSFYSFSPASLVLQALQKKQRVGWRSVQIGYLGIIMEIHSKSVINQSDSGKPNKIPHILCWKHSRCTRLEVIWLGLYVTVKIKYWSGCTSGLWDSNRPFRPSQLYSHYKTLNKYVNKVS